MKPISAEELNSYFDSTLESCSSKILNGSDEEVGWHIFEDLDSSATSFLHASSLEKLQASAFIDDPIKELCVTLRMKIFAALSSHRSVAAVRNEPCWKEIFELSDRIQQLKGERKQSGDGRKNK